MKSRKSKRVVYYVREARELFSWTPNFKPLTIYSLIAHVSGKHHQIMMRDQAVGALYDVMHETNRRNGTNRCAAIPEREDGRFSGIRKIPATPEGRAIVFAYRQNRMDEVGKLLKAQLEIIEADKSKGILTGGQQQKLTGSVMGMLNE